jgi:hypothetical protein
MSDTSLVMSNESWFVGFIYGVCDTSGVTFDERSTNPWFVGFLYVLYDSVRVRLG